MASSHPYIDEARRGVFLHDLDRGLNLIDAALDAEINVKTARGIKRRADEVVIFNDEHDLPSPSLHDRAAKKAKSGRPSILSELNINSLDQAISSDRKHREMPFFEVAEELDLHVSKTTIRNAVQSLHIHRVKPTKKLALTDIQEATRYEIALSRKDWTLNDWKKIVFSDEAAILVGEHRGRHLISRKPWERYEEDCIEIRYNNYSEAMFWGCFSYNSKEPCYIYLKETPAQTAEYKRIIDAHNLVQLPQIQAEWGRKEAADVIYWLSKNRKKPGRPAIFENFRKNHPSIMKRENGKGGIDHMRYKGEVVKPLVLPFMAGLNKDLPRESQFKFQQDNAPSHASKWTRLMLSNAGIQLHEHPGNSPDMNAIEQAWMPLRISITNVWNRPHTLEWTARAWYAEWEALSQDLIREWVHAQIDINQRILDDEGGNHFHG
jgi:hypothetical protein